jgi:putative aminopeptidase FrvX
LEVDLKSPGSKFLLCSFWFLSFCVYAQETETGILASWLALDAPTGHEYLATDTIQQRYAGWQRDRYGNLIKEIGNGEPRRIVACGLDSYAYAVSQITDAGYLRLHRIGSGSRHPLWDQAHEGQQLRILTRGGPLLGVSAIANGHFASQHRGETAIVTQDDLWLDVGAESADEVLAMGIALLDPVLRNIPPWHYATEIAGPRAGARVGCAAVLAAAEAGINGAGGSTRYVLSVQQVFGWVGLGAAISSALAPKQLVIVGPGEPEFRNEEVTQLNARANVVINDSTRANMRFIAPRVTDPDALMERIEMSATNEVLAAIVEAVNPDAELPPWLPAPVRAEVLNGESGRWGQHQDTRRMIEVESILDRVAERSAVPGHEGPIRNIVYNLLPGWAKEVAQVDEMGNMWVEFGPDSEATVFIAHMDEVGYAVESIAANGVLGLTRLGGVVNTAWEGQPALLQLDPNTDLQSLAEAPQLRGIFLGRSEPDQKRPDSVQAWFGMNAEQLADAGVEIGMGMTGFKEGHRMGKYRYASRSLDDRVGTTSLLMAIRNIDPGLLTHRVVFAWSVREEGGLRGAARLAQYFGQNSRRVYSIDTFVSSDTPLESPHFAYAPLGKGPVLRSIESSGMATPYELDRNRGIAAAAGIDVQIGLTQGGTDGTTFAVYGAPNAGLSWPGRYSHSPAEIADLRDVVKLIDLIQAMAEAPLDTP